MKKWLGLFVFVLLCSFAFSPSIFAQQIEVYFVKAQGEYNQDEEGKFYDWLDAVHDPDYYGNPVSEADAINFQNYHAGKATGCACVPYQTESPGGEGQTGGGGPSCGNSGGSSGAPGDQFLGFAWWFPAC